MFSRMLAGAVAATILLGCQSERDRDDDAQSGRTTTTTTASDDLTRSRAGTPARTSQSISEMDRTFVQEAVSGNLFEIRSGQLAIDRNPDPQIAQLASMIVQDHAKANNELKAMARQKGINIPQRMSEPQQRLLDQLRDQHGQEFARQFQNMQEQAHRDAIALFDRQSREGTDPDLKAFARRTLPILRKHMDHVQQYRVP